MRLEKDRDFRLDRLAKKTTRIAALDFDKWALNVRGRISLTTLEFDKPYSSLDEVQV